MDSLGFALEPLDVAFMLFDILLFVIVIYAILSTCLDIATSKNGLVLDLAEHKKKHSGPSLAHKVLNRIPNPEQYTKSQNHFEHQDKNKISHV